VLLLHLICITGLVAIVPDSRSYSAQLTPPRQAAIALLATDKTATDLAGAVRRARQTILEWLKRHFTSNDGRNGAS